MSAEFSGQPCHAVVLAGGSGTRLWPLSRALFPKQLLAFENDLSLLQLTVQRLIPVFGVEHIHIITGEDHVFEVRKQARMLDARLEQGVIAEPVGRNTLPAILLGLQAAMATHSASGTPDKEPLLAVFPSDHHITNDAAFAQDVRKALALAAQGRMLTFGILPHSPDTGFGYIHRGAMLEDHAYRVNEFTEKPDRARAETFVRGGMHFWNSGMFVFPAKALVQAVYNFQPQLAAWWNAAQNAANPLTALLQGYPQLPGISVDYGIMEQAPDVAVVEARFGWDDLGSWEALYRLAAKDEQGCSIQGDVLAFDCKDSLLVSRWGKLAAVGLQNIVAVQTRDATLVCHRDQVQHVKDVVDRLKAENSPLHSVHLTVRRPWGSYTVLEEGPGYKIKRISVDPGGTLSLQLHKQRSEHWVVVQGVAEVRVGEETKRLAEREWVSIGQEVKHRLANPGQIPLELIEIQSGGYLEEDDIVRFEDKYGR